MHTLTAIPITDDEDLLTSFVSKFSFKKFNFEIQEIEFFQFLELKLN